MTLAHRLALAAVLLCVSLARALDAPTLPDTPPARCARAFVEMLNSGTEASVRAFEGAWASRSRLKAASIDDRVPRLASIHKEAAPVTIQSFEGASETGITLIVQNGAGERVEMEFRLSAEEPGRLDTVAIKSHAPQSHPIDADARERAVRAAADAIAKNYVYPEVGAKMSQALLAKLASGGYDPFDRDSALARALTLDAREISHDRHLALVVAPSQEREPNPLDQASPANNFLIHKPEVLPGNVGYFRLDLFSNDPGAHRAAQAAMDSLAGADALIVDLRANGGGEPEMIAFLTSYLFPTRTHLNDMVDREGKTVEEWWTLADLPAGAARLKDNIPVYVLIGPASFSGAEEFAYNLQALKRATIVGQTSGGGAHPITIERVAPTLAVFVPYRRACNPITKTNWEGTGVKPDVECPAGEALDRAQELARKALHDRAR